ncbi:TIGR02678 family protein [Salicibibacter cibarius]|uniref:TIGR02678 family protein n=1 Tax=Salicibibacter cibarius TaxID=2743000 RepID=A0A7T7CCD6_9BACI|nr:TIGR02678 family protein [Salicibibacter cibarius]QQK76889.1 TIGR02678 family protein [Salicibibacter cibarius]
MEFDEKATDALALLFERFWIVRAKDPDAYQMIREREHALKRYVADKFGFDLIIHQHFIKLEKIPVEPKQWMGIQAFKEPMDYGIFCCGLAFTERRSVDEQFLLSDLADDIAEMYPGTLPLDWTMYRHRKALVRALKMMVELSIIKTVDGDVDQFAYNEDEDVLYEVTVYARYFMRTYSDDLVRFQSIDDLLESEWERHAEDERRKRVYRKLMLSPVVYRESESDFDFAYLRKYRNRLRDDFEAHTPFSLELYKNAAMLVMHERKQRYTLFPDQKGIMDVLLHMASEIRTELDRYEVTELGDIRLPLPEVEQLAEKLQTKVGHGWSKHYREATSRAITQDIIDTLESWEMAYLEHEAGILVLQSGFGRMYGVYPRDYDKEASS